jgi:molecular chaperone GrpE
MPTDDNQNIEPNIENGEEFTEQHVNETASDPAGVEAELERVRAERDALYERLARAQADFQNSRKRLETDAEQRLQYANASLIKNLLPTIDNLERAMAVDVAKADAKSVVKGLHLLVDQMLKVLNSHQVEVIAPEPGEPFDPTKHEALMQQPSEEYPPNTITQLLQKGYVLRDRTLRPAQVAVSKVS